MQLLSSTPLGCQPLVLAVTPVAHMNKRRVDDALHAVTSVFVSCRMSSRESSLWTVSDAHNRHTHNLITVDIKVFEKSPAENGLGGGDLCQKPHFYIRDGASYDIFVNL